MSGKEPIDVALAFVAAINGHDVEAIVALLTPDHVLIDSLGFELRGTSALRKGWAGYFAMVPDYSVVVEHTFSSPPAVVLLGAASGTYSPDDTMRPENRWHTPAAWRAVVVGARLSVWQIFADNEPIRAVMRRNAPAH